MIEHRRSTKSKRFIVVYTLRVLIIWTYLHNTSFRHCRAPVDGRAALFTAKGVYVFLVSTVWRYLRSKFEYCVTHLHLMYYCNFGEYMGQKQCGVIKEEMTAFYSIHGLFS